MLSLAKKKLRLQYLPFYFKTKYSKYIKRNEIDLENLVYLYMTLR